MLNCIKLKSQACRSANLVLLYPLIVFLSSRKEKNELSKAQQYEL